MLIKTLKTNAIEILKILIESPSTSRDEDTTACIIYDFLRNKGVFPERKMNNVWAKNKYYDISKPTILLNSHHDTVKPNVGYTRNPYKSTVENSKLYGLGSNDAGGALVALMATFLYFYAEKDIAYNLIFAATAEEEISGKNGIELIYKDLLPLDFAIVGEPTLMNMAIAEKGLIVVDCFAKGKSGHAARKEGINAIEIALKDIQWIHSYVFPKKSDLLGNVKMTVTMINSGTQHNIVPENCDFTIDIRTTETYKNEEIIELLNQNLQSKVVPRSLRLQSSFIDKNHKLVKAGLKIGKNTFASPTLSDQALIKCPSLKIGPGDSARSHTADEFIYIHEIESAIEDYILILKIYYNFIGFNTFIF